MSSQVNSDTNDFVLEHIFSRLSLLCETCDLAETDLHSVHVGRVELSHVIISISPAWKIMLTARWPSLQVGENSGTITSNIEYVCPARTVDFVNTMIRVWFGIFQMQADDQRRLSTDQQAIMPIDCNHSLTGVILSVLISFGIAQNPDEQCSAGQYHFALFRKASLAAMSFYLIIF